jgi:hypothetical protein
VAVYTERPHNAFEVFVRRHGSLFLLGPLFDEQWEEYFFRRQRARRRTAAPMVARQRLRLAGLFDRRERQHAWWSDCVRAGAHWPGAELN